MEQTPEDHLCQAIELARQAAKQMKKAAKLAENAAQLWQQAQILARTTQGDLPQSPIAVEMTVTAPNAPKRQKKQHIKPETTRLIENTPMRNVPRLVPAPVAAEAVGAARLANAWQDGDDWWKPRQPASVAEG